MWAGAVHYRGPFFFFISVNQDGFNAPPSAYGAARFRSEAVPANSTHFPPWQIFSLPPADRYTPEFVLSEAEKGNRNSLNKHLREGSVDLGPARPCPTM